MAIFEGDIKLLESERMADTPDGGGRRTSRVIPDGVPGNIFPKVSRLDATYGRVNLRKIFGQVDTPTLDVYAGAMAAIMDAPDNNRISACLFTTPNATFDDRTAARDRIESYAIAGPESRMVLYGRQLVGQSAIQCFQRVEDVLPEPGEVYCLSAEPGGITAFQQYVRVTDVTHEVRSFDDDRGTFQRRVVTLKIGSTLRYEFVGIEPQRSQAARSVLVRRTNVADAARYYGLQPLAQAAAMGDLQVKVTSVYTPIVPSTTREAPVSQVSLAGAAALQAAAPTGSPVTLTLGVIGSASDVTDGTFVLRLPTAVAPGTVRVRLTSSLTTSGDSTDDGAGKLSVAAASTQNRIEAGSTVDYAAGVLSLNVYVFTGYQATVTCTYMPAVDVSQTAHTRELPVTLATRGVVVVQTLMPLPAPGTLRIDYRALGKWYRLRASSNGDIAGDDAAYGSGTINHSTGALVLTLGALPDVGSSIVMTWGSPAHYAVLAGATQDTGSGAHMRFTLPDVPIATGATFSWTSAGAAKTATAASNMSISGHASGSINTTTGEVVLYFGANVPDTGTVLTVTHNRIAPSDPGNPTVIGGTLAVTSAASISIGHAVQAGTLRMTAYAQWTSGTSLEVLLRDDGSGSMVTVGNTYQGKVIAAGQICGTINYSTGAVTLTNTAAATGTAWNPATAAWSEQSIGLIFEAGDYTVQYQTGSASSMVPITKTVNPARTAGTADIAAPVRIDLTSTKGWSVVPGSVLFALRGKTYFDRDGTLYTDFNASSGSAIEAGVINYASGVCELGLLGATSGALTISSCLTQYGLWTATQCVARMPGSPLRPGSTLVQVTAADGALLVGTTSEPGDVTGAGIAGRVNQDMGIVSLRFGEWLPKAGNETQPWYDEANVVGAQVWRPREVLPHTLRYSTVVLTSLPLNADVLGLDPVRLPSDGRVPIYRPADVVIIHNTGVLDLPNPVSAGATYSCGRTGLADAWLVDAQGAAVPKTQYTVDADAGTVTMASSLSLGSLVQPLRMKHRVEQINMVSDVQIDGTLSLTGPLQRSFVDGQTWVSSALLFGDLFARVTNVFDQQTWSVTWSDSLIGSPAPAQYDTINYPIEVTNDGCVTERWRINFTSSTAFQVIGENLGVIAAGTTASDLQPLNPLTGKAYFTIRSAGWGGGWSAGNQLRFNTVGATAPMWIARTILSGAALTADSIDLQLLGDVDS